MRKTWSSAAGRRVSARDTRRAYMLKQASIGQGVAEHTATALSAATGRPSAWTHRFHHFDPLGNTTAETYANGMVERRCLLLVSALTCWDTLSCAWPIRGTF